MTDTDCGLEESWPGAERRIDIVRAVWNDDMKSTRPTLAALEASTARQVTRQRATAPMAVGS